MSEQLSWAFINKLISTSFTTKHTEISQKDLIEESLATSET